MDNENPEELARSLNVPLGLAAAIQWYTLPVDGEEVSYLDCRPFCLTMSSLTGDKETVNTFGRLRSDNGGYFRGKTPANHGQLDCAITIPFTGILKNGPLYKATQMEDKFDIYHYDGMLYFARSWSGLLLIKANVSLEKDGLKISQIDYDKNYYDASYCLAVMAYLLKSHMLDMVVLHPLPSKIGNNIRDILLYSFSEFGRRGWFASHFNGIGLLGKEKYNFLPHDSGSSD
jgi:hypothetical protein